MSLFVKFHAPSIALQALTFSVVTSFDLVNKRYCAVHIKNSFVGNNKVDGMLALLFFGPYLFIYYYYYFFDEYI